MSDGQVPGIKYDENIAHQQTNTISHIQHYASLRTAPTHMPPSAPEYPVQLIGLNVTGGLAEEGGGLRITRGTVALRSCNVYTNLAMGPCLCGSGGGLHVQQGGEVTLTDTNVHKNTAGLVRSPPAPSWTYFQPHPHCRLNLFASLAGRRGGGSSSVAGQR